jgi:hypothetical protein|tara:strand:- start:4355 stop:5593 length:1239 start_codon:yes stop_codon:yes gene_type:complete
MADAIKENYKKMVTTVKNSIDLKKAKLVQLGVFLVGTLMIGLLFIWSYSKLTLSGANCSYIKRNKLDVSELTRFNYDKPQEQIDNKDMTYGNYKLRDFYIKTAYNCCASGKFSHDFVNECALENCIQLGARCLDFEIYSFDENPIIAVSTDRSFGIKETYNYLEFDRVMSKIGNMAFTGGIDSAGVVSTDPLILHFRIKTNNKEILNMMADSLNKHFYDRLLSRRFSYQYNGKDLGDVQMKELNSKVVIITNNVEKINIEDTKLYEYINIISGGENMRLERKSNVTHAGDMEEIKNFNRERMSICLPDINVSPINLDWRELTNKWANDPKNINNPKIPIGYGIQFIGMSFQNNDSFLKDYISEFNRQKSSFILKPKAFRKESINVEIDITKLARGPNETAQSTKLLKSTDWQ